MIDFNADIVSGHSIGNVFLNDDIGRYFSDMYSFHHVEVKEYYIPDGTKKNAYILDDTMKIVVSQDGIIFSIGCNQEYKGLYNTALHTGQTMSEIFKFTKKQRIFNGSIIIDDDFGVSFVLPFPYDEIADAINDIPPDLVINEVYVSDYSSWNPNAN